MADITIIDRAQGALLGLACGDAVGTALEFKKRGTFTPITDMIGGGLFKLKKGQWTDDTSMALCLGYSLLEQGTFDAKDQMQRYCRWKNEGYLSSTGRCFDIGNTILKALKRFELWGDPLSGSKHHLSAGNGSIMRLAPIPIFYHRNINDVITYAALSSETTHGCQECIESCQFFATQICAALNGRDKEYITHNIEFEPNSLKVAAIKEAQYLKEPYEQLTGSGYVIESLESALWCFYNSQSFKEAILLAANLGNDADTTAAVCGQIAGAYYGIENIPKDWLDSVSKSKDIKELAKMLVLANH